MKDKVAAETEEAPKKLKAKAKKDFIIYTNDFYREIKTGDDLSDISKIYVQNLKTEGVL